MSVSEISKTSEINRIQGTIGDLAQLLDNGDKKAGKHEALK